MAKVGMHCLLRANPPASSRAATQERLLISSPEAVPEDQLRGHVPQSER